MLISIPSHKLESAIGMVDEAVNLIVDLSYSYGNPIIHQIFIGEEPIKGWVKDRIKEDACLFILRYMPEAMFNERAEKYNCNIVALASA